MKIRQRENILYGTNTQPPLYDRGKLPSGEQGYGNNVPEDGVVPVFSMGTFKYRMILAILLFVGFLICDTGGDRIGRYTTGDIHEMIIADTFHLYDGDGNDTMDGLAALFGSQN
ncbi:MAG: hypothetical protein NC416_17825 [Eubacterium sp.]|nr:hypothetical protein [Eubacterium sp.]